MRKMPADDQRVALSKVLASLLVTLVVMLPGCSKNPPERLRAIPAETLSCNVPMTDVLHLEYGGQAQQFRTLSDESEWCSLWDRIYSIDSPKPPCDTSLIDFRTEVALVAAIGGRPDGCFSVKITCVHRDSVSNSLTVYVTESTPGANCLCTASLVNPIDVVKVSDPVGFATFIQQTAPASCH
jgi:hypothetical protein